MTTATHNATPSVSDAAWAYCTTANCAWEIFEADATVLLALVNIHREQAV